MCLNYIIFDCTVDCSELSAYSSMSKFIVNWNMFQSWYAGAAYWSMLSINFLLIGLIILQLYFSIASKVVVVAGEIVRLCWVLIVPVRVMFADSWLSQYLIIDWSYWQCWINDLCIFVCVWLNESASYCWYIGFNKIDLKLGNILSY